MLRANPPPAWTKELDQGIQRPDVISSLGIPVLQQQALLNMPALGAYNQQAALRNAAYVPDELDDLPSQPVAEINEIRERQREIKRREPWYLPLAKWLVA